MVDSSVGPGPVLIEFIPFSDFSNHQRQPFPGTCLPSWDIFVYTLQESASNFVPQLLNIRVARSD